MKNRFLKIFAPAIVAAGLILPSVASATVYSNDTNVAIADYSTISSEIEISDIGSLASITVEVGVTHTSMSDLVMTLVSPDGTEILLYNSPGLYENLYSSNPFIFDDSAATAISDATSGGTYIPEEALSSLIGEAGAGTWTLVISDTVSGDKGTLDYWSLDIVYASVEAVPEPAVLSLLGLGLIGVGIARRRRKA